MNFRGVKIIGHVLKINYALIICFPVGRPPENPREPRRNGTVVFLFSPRGRGKQRFGSGNNETTSVGLISVLCCCV